MQPQTLFYDENFNYKNKFVLESKVDELETFIEKLKKSPFPNSTQILVNDFTKLLTHLNSKAYQLGAKKFLLTINDLFHFAISIFDEIRLQEIKKDDDTPALALYYFKNELKTLNKLKFEKEVPFLALKNFINSIPEAAFIDLQWKTKKDFSDAIDKYLDTEAEKKANLTPWGERYYD